MASILRYCVSQLKISPCALLTIISCFSSVLLHCLDIVTVTTETQPSVLNRNSKNVPQYFGAIATFPFVMVKNAKPGFCCLCFDSRGLWDTILNVVERKRE